MNFVPTVDIKNYSSCIFTFYLQLNLSTMKLTGVWLNFNTYSFSGWANVWIVNVTLVMINVLSWVQLAYGQLLTNYQNQNRQYLPNWSDLKFIKQTNCLVQTMIKWSDYSIILLCITYVSLTTVRISTMYYKLKIGNNKTQMHL